MRPAEPLHRAELVDIHGLKEKVYIFNLNGIAKDFGKVKEEVSSDALVIVRVIDP